MSSIAANRLIVAVVLSLTLGHAAPAFAARPAGAADVVIRLYKDFAWQAMTGQPELFGKNLAHQDKSTLSRYFSPVLVDLLMKDATCQRKYQGICNLDFDLLFDSQDPRVIDLDVDAGVPGKISIVFKDPVDDKRTQIDFEVARFSGTWKIVDIVYRNNGTSLKTLLSRRVPTD